VVARGDTAEAEMSPMGFVLSDRVLITVRFARLKPIDLAAHQFAYLDRPTSVTAFTVVLEAVGDRLADLLETAQAELDQISRRIFRSREMGRPIARANAQLRETLIQVGQLGDRLGKIRGALLGVARLAPFAVETGREWIGPEYCARLNAVRTDVLSLADYETHLDGKTQFLLDAVLGFINTEQNDLFKILTIVSVVGVPPTLVASVYGMNFAVMPELHWRFGYPYALALIVLTTVLPMAWFKWKRWW
jgi:magnesium transporter